MGDHMVPYEPDHDADDYEEDFEEEEVEEESLQNSPGVADPISNELEPAPPPPRRLVDEDPADETPQETPRFMCEEGVHCVAEDDELNPVLQLQQLREHLDAFSERMDAVHHDVVDEEIIDSGSPADSPTKVVVEEGAAGAESHHDKQDGSQQEERLRCELDQAKHRATEMLQKFMEACPRSLLVIRIAHR